MIIEKVIETFEKYKVDNKKILVLLPDSTRSGPTDIFFKAICDTLSKRVKKLDFLICLGTHPLMNEDKIKKFLKIDSKKDIKKYGKFKIFNHRWDIPETFKTIGKISSSEIYKITDGLFKQEVEISVNKIIFNYDFLVIYGPVFPHEVVGFSGGYKYIFPGISENKTIGFFHWLGAIITNLKINGVKDNPVRRFIDRAVKFINIPCIFFCSVIKDGKLKGIFSGEPQKAWNDAVDLSSKVNIIYKDRPFKKVLGISPDMYDDIWTAGKVMYKLESVVEDGGDLIIYAPHITEISYTFGKILDEIGYHVKDYFLKQFDKFKIYPWGVLAHSTHVKGTGTFIKGIEKPRINVFLATGIPEERCKKVNLGYINPETIKINDFTGKEDKGILLVQHAGETLYKLKE